MFFLVHDGIENVCKVDNFFCIEVTDGKFQKFVQAIKYSNAPLTGEGLDY